MLPKDSKGPNGNQEEEGGWSEVRRRGKQPQHGNINGGTVRCEHSILKVNIARYQKQSNVSKYATIPKTNPPKPIPIDKSVREKPWHPAQPPRSYAETVAGAQTRTTTFNTPIPITPVAFSKDMDNCVMVDEPISLQHIAELPTILPLNGNPSGKVHYIGGTNVLIKFSNSASAKAFHDNEHKLEQMEKLAWVTIFGLPVRFRSAENYERIATAVGKPLQSDIQDWTRFDISDGNVCILTKNMNIINMEINVVFDNKIHRVGVVEYDRDWKPYDQVALVAPEIEEMEEDDDEMSEDNYDDADDEEFVDDTDSDEDIQSRKDDTIEE
ncbi:hypothetical protein LXL04_036873 [Taraxacum kok-saghyz]